MGRILTKGFTPAKINRVVPRNPRQQSYVDLLIEDKPYIVLATGSAGTGKTMIATHVGVEKLLKEEVDKIIITRPAVSVDEQLGFLPGTLEKKMEPWIRPVLDVLEKSFAPKMVESMMKDKIIEICPLATMRGRDFSYSWIICDEAQNTTVNQLLMVMTRIGEGSKLVIAGDPKQYDRGYAHNGLCDLLYRLESHESLVKDNFGVIEFTEEDVERHPVIPIVLAMYSDYKG